MSGSPPFQLETNDDFEAAVEKLRKSHYRKSPKESEAFLSKVADVITNLQIDPYGPNTRPEGWPHGAVDSEFDYRKVVFEMPGRRGASGEGRILYLVDKVARVLMPSDIYTHEEYRKMPRADKSMTRRIRAIVQALKIRDGR